MTDLEFSLAVKEECEAIHKMLIEKNKSYGNSALDPIRCFSKLDPIETIKIRIDDKLSRLMRGSEYGSDDSIKDLIGYLVLLRIAQKQKE